MRDILFIRSFPLLVLTIVLTCCKNDKPSDSTENHAIEVEVTPMSKPIRLSDYFRHDFDVIRLNGDVIGYIYIFFETDSLYILHGRATKGLVLTFDKNGNFIRSLLTRGQGADEVIDISSVKLIDNKLYALVNLGRELWTIDPYNGQITDKFEIPEEIRYPKDFNIVGNNIVFYKSMTNLALDNEQYKLYVYNMTDKSVVRRYLPIDKVSCEYISFSPNGNIVADKDGSLLFMEVFQNGIMRLDSLGNANSYISFVPNKYTFPDSKLHGNNTFEGFINYCKASDYIWAHVSINKLPDLILSYFIFQEETYLNIINTVTASSQSSTTIIDDLVSDTKTEVSEWGKIIGTRDNNLYVSYPYMLFENYKKGFSTAYDDIFSTMNPDSNDLIIVFHEKD